MAVLPEPSELASQILSIFLNDFNSRPGSGRRVIALMSKWRGRNNDFAAGADYALEKGWLEESQAGAAFRLTEAGFAQAGGILPTPEASARQLLTLCVNRFRARPEGLVMLRNLNLTWLQDLHNTAADFDSGLEFALEKRWLEDAGNGMSLRVTEAGFAEA